LQKWLTKVSSGCFLELPRCKRFSFFVFTFNLCPGALTRILELTPAEEAAAKAKEAAEQAALPYKWSQTIGDLDITVEVPGNLKGRDLNVDIKKKKLVVGVKGQEPVITVYTPPLLLFILLQFQKLTS